MDSLAFFVQNDIKPAFGCTEPGAIAFACAKARSVIGGEIENVELYFNSGIYKNALTCPIPGTDDMGKDFAAALGIVAGDSGKGLLVIEDITDVDITAAHKLLATGKIHSHLKNIDSEIYIEANIETTEGSAVVIIKKEHTNIVEIHKNGEVIFQADCLDVPLGTEVSIKNYTFRDIYDYALTGPLDEMEFLKVAFEMDMALLREGLSQGISPMTSVLISQNRGKIMSDDWQKNAEIAACAAIEARLSGAGKPAMSLTGSGSHGILAMMPVYAMAKTLNIPIDRAVRATMLSCLVTMYIKAYCGKLSALCGCAIAGGTGSAVGMCMLLGGGYEQMCRTIDNMASSVVGMICHGGNPGCVMKAIAGICSAFKAAQFAVCNVSIDPVHGIVGDTPEKTMQNIGYISSPGMAHTEKYILDIMKSK